MRPAQRLYARLGFTRLPARDFSPLPGVDLEVFTRALHHSSAHDPDARRAK
jgi:hypothetical protein